MSQNYELFSLNLWKARSYYLLELQSHEITLQQGGYFFP